MVESHPALNPFLDDSLLIKRVKEGEEELKFFWGLGK